MANNTTDVDYLVEILNDEKLRLMIPALIYIIFLMICGFIGNLMVCFYYGFKTKITTNSIFICVLAIYDLIVCAIAMPTEIADIVFFYTFQSNVACKILRFVNYLSSLGSIFTLITISVDRYRRICKRSGRQMSIGVAKLSCLLTVVAAVLLAWPSLLIYGSIKVNIPNDYGVALKGSDCTSTKASNYRPYVWAFNITHFGLFIICSTVLTTMYCIIGRVIFLHKKRMTAHKSDTLSPATSSNPSTEETSLDNSGKVTKEPRKSTKKSMKTKKPPKHKEDENIKLTIVMITITVLFVISFLPYLSLTVWRIVKGKHEAEFLSDAGLVAFKIGSRSFLLNSAVNPWVYGVFNSQFRAYFCGCLCRICRQK